MISERARELVLAYLTDVKYWLPKEMKNAMKEIATGCTECEFYNKCKESSINTGNRADSNDGDKLD